MQAPRYLGAAMLGDRPLGFIVRNAVRRENWRALARMARVYVHPADAARRYFTGGGDYPHRPHVRTPAGVVAPTTYGHDDFITVNEVFCRGDYPASREVATIIDVGSNIGISALFFLTRNATARVHLFEPVPRNVERLRANLAGFEDRYTLTEAAVWDRNGTVGFGVEPTGRYGGIGRETAETIQVQVLDINDVLGGVLATTPRVDILKLDTEGSEFETIASIREEYLDRIGAVYFETEERRPVHPDRFEASYACDVCRLVPRHSYH